MKSIIFAIFALLAISTVVKAQDCSTCELVVNFIESWVESNATEAEIQQYLNTLCGLVPGYTAICDQIADSGLTEVIGWINANENAQTICTQLGMCSSKFAVKPVAGKTTIIKPKLSTLSKVKLPSIKKPNMKAQKVGDIECDGCNEVISIIEEWLEEASSQQEIINAVEVVCTYMPDWETTCDAIIASGVPEVIQWIETAENASVVCNQLGLCSKLSVQSVRKFTDDCGDCGQIVTLIENYIDLSATEQQIEAYLDLACQLVPQWSSVCASYINGYVPQIISWINQNENPTTVCTQIGVCSSKSKLIVN